MEFKFILAILAFTSVAAVDQKIPSYLRFIESFKYNATEDGQVTVQKNYYLSERVEFTAIDAITSCLSAGIRLATIENNLELENLKKLAQTNPNLFKKKVVIEGNNLVEDKNADDCLVFSFLAETAEMSFVKTNCSDGIELNIMCEEVIFTYEREEDSIIEDKVDVKAQFLDLLGEYKSESEHKSYYFSEGMFRTASVAHQICEALDMVVAAPKDQSEFENLKQLLIKAQTPKSTFVTYHAFLIDGYRSTFDEDLFLSGNKPINFVDETKKKNSDSEVNCLALYLGNYKTCSLVESLCYRSKSFICEFDHTRSRPRKISNYIGTYMDRFLEPLTTYAFRGVEKSLFISKFSMTYLKAKLTCETLGMRLVEPKSEEEDTEMRRKLFDLEKDLQGVFVGFASKDKLIFSVQSGTVIKFIEKDVDWRNNSWDCLYLTKDHFHKRMSYAFGNNDIDRFEGKFICEKGK